jgi:cobalt-zinc-cadmium efflux system membrane fusion protein
MYRTETHVPVQQAPAESADGTPPDQQPGRKEGPAENPVQVTVQGKFQNSGFNRTLVIGLALAVLILVGVAAVPFAQAVLKGETDKGEAGMVKASVLPAELIREDRTAEELRRAYPELTEKEVAALRQKLGPKYGLRLTAEAAAGLGEAAAAYTPTEPRPLPPRVGTVNYDNDRLFILQSRFQGEVGVLKELRETGTPTAFRPLRYGDRFSQGELLAVVWSKDLGTVKAALVDAICALRLSKDQLVRYEKLYRDGAIPLAVYKAQERQVQGDSGSVLTAKRTLKMWRLTDSEIKEVEDEANKIIDLKLVRNADYEKKWAEVYITIPKVASDPKFELTLVEKNVNLHQMVDPTTVMFKLADLSRLTVWVQPPEEDLPLLQDRMERGARLKWEIQFQSDPPGTRPQELDIALICPSYDPNVHTPMLMGYLPNKDNRRRIGQFVTATIFVDPDPDTVEIPTNAINDVEGQTLVWVEKDAKKREYVLRRVAVEHCFEKKTIVRSKLTEKDKQLSEIERARGRRPIEPLLPGERVLTDRVVELTAALDNLVSAARLNKQ